MGAGSSLRPSAVDRIALTKASFAAYSLAVAALVSCTAVTPEQQKLETAMAALEGQRPALGDLVVDAMMSGLRAKLATLQRPVVLQRRQVTVLFADVVGSTAMASGMDASYAHLDALLEVQRTTA